MNKMNLNKKMNEFNKFNNNNNNNNIKVKLNYENPLSIENLTGKQNNENKIESLNTKNEINNQYDFNNTSNNLDICSLIDTIKSNILFIEKKFENDNGKF